MGGDFADSVAEKENLLTNLDPRLKLLVCLTGLIGIMSAKHVLLPLLVLALLFILFGWLRVSPALLGKRLGMPLLLAVIIFLSQGFLYGNEIWAEIRLGSYVLTVSRDGLAHGLLLALRVMAGVSLLLSLALTTAMDKIIYALSWVRVPQELIEIMIVAHRYIGVFNEEMARVRKAQKMRLGYATWQNGMKSAASLGGIILLRAFDKSERLYRSMAGRGYTGSLAVTKDVIASGHGNSCQTGRN